MIIAAKLVVFVAGVASLTIVIILLNIVHVLVSDTSIHVYVDIADT